MAAFSSLETYSRRINKKGRRSFYTLGALFISLFCHAVFITASILNDHKEQIDPVMRRGDNIAYAFFVHFACLPFG